MDASDNEFETWWAAYPKKLAKGDARKAWRQTARMRPALSALLSALENARGSEQWSRDGGQYIPYPATWLRSERWDDEYEVSTQVSRPSITCIVCKGKTFTWTDGKCTACWQKYMGIREPA